MTFTTSQATLPFVYDVYEYSSMPLSTFSLQIYNMAFLTAIVVPVIAFVQSVVARYVVQHVAILLLGFVTFGVLFGPKLTLLIKHDDAELLKLFKSGSTTSAKTSALNHGTNKYIDEPSVTGL